MRLIEINTIGRLEMSVCYDKLWKMLIDKRMNKTDLKDKAGISFNVLAKMGKGESVSLESLHKICKTLKCDIGKNRTQPARAARSVNTNIEVLQIET